MRRLLFLFICLPVLLVFNLLTVYACSGGGYATFEDFLQYHTDHSSVIVVGHFIELDAVNYNGIFEVERYLAGETTAQYLTVGMNDVRLVTNSYEIHRNYPCWVNKLLGRYGGFNRTSQYILFLDATDEGIYRPAIQRYFQFASADAEFGGWDQTFTSEEIQERLTELTGQSYLPEIAEATSLPRTTPVLVTTTDGQNYVIPVDSDVPFAISAEDASLRVRNQITCNIPPCDAWSPNGLDRVHLLRSEDEAITRDDYDITQVHNVVGDRVMMSTSNDAFALWLADGRVEIYALWSPDYAFPDWIGDGQYRPVYLHDIQLNPTALNYPAIWSPDGRLIYFSDDDGLWMLDAYSADFPPQLILPADHTIPVARYFSPQGRYLAVTDGEQNYNLDLVTRRELPDGYLNPSDRILLVFDTANEDGSTLEIMHLAPNDLRREFYADVLYHQVHWTDETRFLASVSGIGYFEYDTIAMDDGSYELLEIPVEEPFFAIRSFSSGIYMSTYDTAPYRDIQPPFFNRFVYDPHIGTIYISEDDYHIQFSGITVDMSEYVDSPVESAEWLPSAFYYEPD